MKRIYGACALLIFIASAYGQETEKTKDVSEKTFTGDPVAFTCKRPNTDENIPLKAAIPV